jgi:hypothetical protein
LDKCRIENAGTRCAVPTTEGWMPILRLQEACQSIHFYENCWLVVENKILANISISVYFSFKYTIADNLFSVFQKWVLSLIFGEPFGCQCCACSVTAFIRLLLGLKRA